MKEIQKTFLQENKIKKSKSAKIGSVLLIVSAILPCIDVVFKRYVPGMDTLKDSQGVLVTVDIWLVTLFISPALILLAVSFRPNPKLYFFPLLTSFYSGTVYFSPILGGKVDFLKVNSWTFFIVSAAGALLYMWLLKYIRWLRLDENASDHFKNDLKEEIKRLKQENEQLKSNKHQI
ncbi:hypothetical protein [Chryseobacterium sp. JV274]|uniref:hypothetical protein n=1 Tax=Chryseobacterium sp. JV274 TaxID=1932669 RepID=UPI0015C1D0F2|nr:hypothetical protein [Chryseobacterium sp. JV274]CAD0220428.1 conserved membrane protein of unknown function [Chryseobacterium sp. JV274]